jgi:predicted site-specific integrase-resolvase
MTAKEVLRIFQITRPTLSKYVKEGRLKVTVKGNGRYDYDADSVYKMLNKDIERKTYLYARVSTPKQKKTWKTKFSCSKISVFRTVTQSMGSIRMLLVV